MNKIPSESKTGWRQDPETVKADILAVATQIFSEHGFAGARVDEIVRRTKTSKRMIYYYFGDKRGLYLNVLEAAYTKLRTAEQDLEIEDLDPFEALDRLIEFSFDYHRKHPEYVRLIASENINNGLNLKQSKTIPKLNSQIIASLEAICRRGVVQGVFRADLKAIELHWAISAFSVFNVSNTATFSHHYGDELFTEEGQTLLKSQVISMVRAFVSIAG